MSIYEALLRFTEVCSESGTKLPVIHMSSPGFEELVNGVEAATGEVKMSNITVSGPPIMCVEVKTSAGTCRVAPCIV